MRLSLFGPQDVLDAARHVTQARRMSPRRYRPVTTGTGPAVPAILLSWTRPGVPA